jgi:hypothetical protein
VTLGLTLRFTRLSDDRYRFEYRRADGSGEAIEMETAAHFRRDLLHYVVEQGAGLRGSFYGLLERIGGYEELVIAGGAALGGEMAITERVVGAIAEAMSDDAPDDADFAARVIDNLALYGERGPRWLTVAFILAAVERIRELDSRWLATQTGETLELMVAA